MKPIQFFSSATADYSPLLLREPPPLHSALSRFISHSFLYSHLFPSSFCLSLFISLYLFPTFSLPIPPSLQYRLSSSLPLLSLPQLPFLLPSCISPPPSPKPAWQNLLQEGRLISIANTQRPPQPNINLHLSVMNISHLPQEGFIQRGRVGSGNVALEHELGSAITYRCGKELCPTGNQHHTPRVLLSLFWIQESNPALLQPILEERADQNSFSLCTLHSFQQSELKPHCSLSVVTNTEIMCEGGGPCSAPWVYFAMGKGKDEELSPKPSRRGLRSFGHSPGAFFHHEGLTGVIMPYSLLGPPTGKG